MSLEAVAAALAALGLSPVALFGATVAVAVSAAVQAVTGSGFGILAAPALLMLAPQLVPGPLLVVTLLVMTLTLLQNRIRPGELTLCGAAAWSLPGAAAGVGLVSVAPAQVTGTIIGVALMTAGVAALRGWSVPQTAGTLRAAGAAGGLLSGLAATPGPPVTLVFRHEDLRVYRGSLAVYFLVSCALSLLLLVAADPGQAGGTAALGALLVPGVLLGTLAAGPLRGRLAVRTVRRGSFVLSGLAGLTVLIRSLVG